MSRPALWKPFITVASYVFYGAASWSFCFLLAGITAGNQLAAVLIGRAQQERVKRGIVAITVALDLGVLGVFKYYGFFAQQTADVLQKVGLGMPLPLVQLALPVGVSFFTFQAISYVVDVKRGLLEPARWLDATVYLSFFPHLVAGPIVRAREFLPQLATPRDPEHVAVGAGIELIALGLVKKVVIADFLARTVVDPVFAVPQAYGGVDALTAAYAYTAQIYCDFSGYTDMAIGLALLMGFVFPQNFRSPYRATGLRDFWRRWHMTLSRFLRDFLYIPLGGNRHGRLLTYRNLLITMVLGGLWHGAAWTFILWGALHGVGLIVEHALGGRVRMPGWLRWLVTFHVVVFGWILFRSPSLSAVGIFLSRFIAGGSATLLTPLVLISLLAVIGLQLIPIGPVEALQVAIARTRPILLGVGLAVVIVFAGATVSSQGVPPFIYFRF
ncbi:MAG TPA: MBOAT family protein [Solirubrobacteraceae bacterium]|nr:MBOAT family protein [Solirubrobacteraceae bacterium]